MVLNRDRERFGVNHGSRITALRHREHDSSSLSLLRFSANLQRRPFLSPAFRPNLQWSTGSHLPYARLAHWQLISNDANVHSFPSLPKLPMWQPHQKPQPPSSQQLTANDSPIRSPKIRKGKPFPGPKRRTPTHDNRPNSITQIRPELNNTKLFSAAESRNDLRLHDLVHLPPEKTGTFTAN